MASTLFSFSPQNFCLNSFLKKPALKKFVIFFLSKQSFSYISGNGTLDVQASAPNIFPRKILIFFPKNLALKIFLIFSQKKHLIFWKLKLQIILIFQETELSYTSQNSTFLYFRKRNFVIFWERYIQNLDIFRRRSIFRTLSYLKPETYSEHSQTS